MYIVNGTKFHVDVTQATAKNRRNYAVLVAKSTYSFPEKNDHDLVLSEEQLPIYDADIYSGEPGESDLMFESDWVYYKNKCDVVVHANAYAPEGRQVKSISAAFKVGQCEKKVVAIGDRIWQKDGSNLRLTSPAPFSSMPISYSRSYGGTWLNNDEGDDFADSYAQNPIGSGFAERRHRHYLQGKTAPNIAASINDFDRNDFNPIAFGPLGRGWPQRAQYAGTYDQNWIDNIFPLWPDDFDERYFQSVPEDQQIDYPKGGETIELWNMHPKREYIRFSLPKKLELPAVAVLKKSRRQKALTPVVDTLNIDIDAQTVSIVWRASLPIRRSLTEIQTMAAGNVCKRWWKSQLYGTKDCGCGGVETDDDDLMPVNQAIK